MPRSQRYTERLNALSAMCVMAIGMGIGRFSFTAIYPYMLDEQLLDLTQGSVAASFNYLGYLIGAILAVKIRVHHSHHLSLWSVIGTSACLLLMAVIQHPYLIILVRGIAGLFSALAIVSASLWLLEHCKQTNQAPVLYSGVGVGIAFSSELIALGHSLPLTSQGLWGALGIVSLIIGILISYHMVNGKTVMPASVNMTGEELAKTDSRYLVFIYGLSGFGYIITATYLPVLVKMAIPDIEVAHIWAVFGLGAIPSCFIWHKIKHRMGNKWALTVNLLIQAIGVILPVLVASPISYMASALLVGGTFMGTVTIALPMAQKISKQSKGNLVAVMTIVYGIGQIFGPLAASSLFSLSNNFSASLLLAAAALFISAAISTRKVS